jgi:cell division protein FtsZ
MFSEPWDGESTAKITVIGLGGAGGNALNRMIPLWNAGVRFVCANTDAQDLSKSLAPHLIQLGPHITGGLGSGGNPEIGRQAAEESKRELEEAITGSDLVIIAAGMGGGTGTGAAPVVARLARSRQILTIAVVTKPFKFEFAPRARVAEEGIEELLPHVDTLICVPNERLLEVAPPRATLQEAFLLADRALHHAVQGIAEIIIKPGLINVDFADVRAVLQNAGMALIGIGEGSGESRARDAVESAVTSPLLETTMDGAKRLLVNITSSSDFTLSELQEAMERVAHFCDPDAEVILGHTQDEEMAGSVRVTVIATGMTGRKAGKTPATAESTPHSTEPAFREAPISAEPPVLDIPSFLKGHRERT